VREMFTVVCVLSNNLEINKRWVLQHANVIGSEYSVLLVDNTTFCDINHLLLLEKAARLGWKVIRNCLPVVPNHTDDTHLSHSAGLDVAMQYVTTPYIITMDNDLFIPTLEPLDYLVEQALSNNAVVVGWEVFPYIAYPYITPHLTVYKVDVVRSFPLAARWVSSETMRDRYGIFYASQYADVDEYKDVRLAGYLDVGQYTHYEAVLAGYRVIKLDMEKWKVWGIVHVGSVSDTRYNDSHNPFHAIAIFLPIKVWGDTQFYWNRIQIRTDGNYLV